MLTQANHPVYVVLRHVCDLRCVTAYSLHHIIRLSFLHMKKFLDHS